MMLLMTGVRIPYSRCTVVAYIPNQSFSAFLLGTTPREYRLSDRSSEQPPCPPLHVQESSLDHVEQSQQLGRIEEL